MQRGSWRSDLDFLGAVTCISKSVDPPRPHNKVPSAHCQVSEPMDQWQQECSAGNPAHADFRPVINATVDFIVVSALWILEVGHIYDFWLDRRYAVGNRLHRWRPREDLLLGVAGMLFVRSISLVTE